MWHIKSNSETLKTFKIDTVFEFIINSENQCYEFIYEYLPLTKGEFLKKFLNISGDYNRYIQLEKKMISKENKYSRGCYLLSG